jgi:hypothetical protein
MESLMKAFVDRIEGEVAVLLIGGRQWDLPAAVLPPGAAEGDTVEITVAMTAEPRPGYDDFDWRKS